ncbi:MAG: glucose-1-phosphate cytidylyltransferase [Pelagibacteraceae bacterium]|nr:glucose-1-phosphate cytidylyltransferase [Pelagibacteraceae bacterium]|tara:strand:- start:2312 stop:3010 length:699 start_codon:yes stop_codon:yes gene_type:complete
MKVVILCGGIGSRLEEETKSIPKPMVKIGKIPIVQHIINYYKCFGYNDFILATGYKKEVIEKYYKNNKNVKCVFTGKNTLTGGRILRLKKFFKKNENFLMTYGDGLTNQNLDKLVSFHIRKNKIATLTSVKPPARFGELKISRNRVSSFKEKPQLQNNWINGGFFVFNSKIFNFISGDKIMLEREPFQKLTKSRNLMAFKHYGFWQCMDTMRDKNLLEKLWKKKKAPWIKLK